MNSEQPPPSPVQVEVLTETNLPAYQDFTHGDGRVDFTLVPEGRYKVRVSGSGYQTVVTEPFTILHNEHLHTEMVYVTQAKKDGDSSAQPTVSAYDLNVPPEARDLVEKASDLFAKGQEDAAIAAIQKALKIYPKYARAHYNLAVALARKGDLPGARRSFEESLKVNDRFVPSMIGLARMDLKVPGLAQASQWTEKAVAVEPNNLEALTMLASIKFYQGLFSDALITVGRVHMQPHSGFGEAHLIAAEIYQKQGDSAKALQECELFLKEEPKSPRAEQVRRGMKVIADRPSASLTPK